MAAARAEETATMARDKANEAKQVGFVCLFYNVRLFIKEPLRWKLKTILETFFPRLDS